MRVRNEPVSAMKELSEVEESAGEEGEAHQSAGDCEGPLNQLVGPSKQATANQDAALPSVLLVQRQEIR